MDNNNNNPCLPDNQYIVICTRANQTDPIPDYPAGSNQSNKSSGINEVQPWGQIERYFIQVAKVNDMRVYPDFTMISIENMDGQIGTVYDTNSTWWCVDNENDALTLKNHLITITSDHNEQP